MTLVGDVVEAEVSAVLSLAVHASVGFSVLLRGVTSGWLGKGYMGTLTVWQFFRKSESLKTKKLNIKNQTVNKHTQQYPPKRKQPPSP